MITVRNTVLAAIAATSTMTLFSYIVSKKEGENFKEPELLGEFINKSFDTSKKASEPLGWVVHYITGVGFTGAYKMLLSLTNRKPNVQNGISFGTFAGAIGVLTWNTLFKNHSNPPKTHRIGYYAQLMIAHLIFGLTLSIFSNKRIDSHNEHKTLN
jgi:hypothetical protein